MCWKRAITPSIVFPRFESFSRLRKRAVKFWKLGSGELGEYPDEESMGLVCDIGMISM
jgi:hypothetical protein